MAYNLTKPGSDTNKIMSCPASQNTGYGDVTMAADTHEVVNLFYEYLRLSTTSRIAHIYVYTTKRGDKITYIKY